MSEDIVAQLRGWSEGSSDDSRRMVWLMRQSADTIEALRGENARLKDALVEVEGRLNCRGNPDIAHYCPNCDNSLHKTREIARKALGETT